MRLQELFETTADDRNITRVTNELYSYISSDYAGFEFDGEETSKNLGKMGEILDLPSDSPFRNVSVVLVSPDQLWKDYKPDEPFDPYTSNAPSGIWDSATKSIELNSTFIQSHKLKQTIAHELRHGLDDIKSGSKANTSVGYSTPRNKSHRVASRDDDHTPYLAEPAEINARTMEVQQELSKIIPMVYNTKAIGPADIKPRIQKAIKELLVKYKISTLFPEKEKSSQYKRLISRIMSYSQDVMKEQEAKKNKVAQGNW